MKLKKGLSLLLALAMIIGLLPTISIAADTVANPVYLFTTGAYNCPDAYYGIWNNTYQLDRTKSTGYYEYVSAIGLNDCRSSSTAIMPWNNVEERFGNAAIVLKATVDETATYDATIEYVRYKYSGKFGIYFVPKAYADTKWTMTALTDIKPILSDENTIALVKDLDSNLQAGSETIYTAEGFEIEAGDYYVLITVDKSAYPTNDGTRYYSCIKSIALTQQKEAEAVKNPIYLFTTGAYNCPDRYYNISTGTYPLDRTKSTGYYEFVSAVGLNDMMASSTSIMPWNNVEERFGNAALVLKATVEETATYAAEVVYERYKYSGKIGIYFVPAAYADTKWTMTALTDIKPIISDEKTIAIVKDLDSNLQAGSDTVYTAEDFDLEAGDYYVLMTIDKSAYPTNDGTRYYACVRSISLTQQEETEEPPAGPPAKDLVYLFTKDAYNCPDRYYTISKGTYPLDRTKSTGYYEFVSAIGLNDMMSSATEIAPWNNVEERFGNAALVLKATVEGTGTYDAIINYQRYKYSGKIGVYFVPVTYADSKWTMTALTDIKPILSDAKTVKFVSGLDSNAQAGSDTAYTAKDIALAAGDYYVLITVDKSDYPTNDGTRYYSCVHSIELKAHKEFGDAEYVTYNFSQTGRPDISTHGTMLEDPNGKWNAGLAEYPENPTDPGHMWAYAGTGATYAAAKTMFGWLARYISVNRYYAEEWTAFRIKVPASGTYLLDSGTAYKYKNSASNLKMYLVPIDAALKEKFSEGSSIYGTTSDAKGTGYYWRTGHATFPALGISEDYLIGSTNLLKEGDNFDDPIELSNTKELSLKAKNEYLLIFRSAETAGVPSITTLTFAYKADPIVLDHIEATFGDNNNVYIGSKLTPKVKWFTDEEEILGANGDVSFELIEDEDGIVIEDEEGNLFASKTGEIKLKVTGVYKEIEKSCEVTVNVIVDDSYAGVDASYLFYLNAYPDTSVGFTTAEGVTEKTFTENCLAQDYSAERPWGLIASNATRPNGAKTYFPQSSLYMDTSGKVGEWIALKVKVPKAGKYVIDASAYSYKSAGVGEIYMTPYKDTMTFADITANINTYMAKENLVAAPDFNSNAEGVVRFSGVGTFIASEDVDYSKGYGEYLMIIKTCSSKLNPSGYAILINSIYLVGSAGIESVKVGLADTAIGIGESTKIESVVAKNLTGGEIDLSEGYVSHSVAEGSEDIIALEDDGVTIRALSEGKAKIKTRVLVEGSVAETETEITVDDKLRIINAYLYSTSVVSVDEAVSFFTRVEYNNKKLGNIGDIVGYEIVEESTDGVLNIAEDGITVTAAKAGTAIVRAKLAARGNVYTTDNVKVTVLAVDMNYPSNFTIDFRKGVYAGDTYTKLEEIKSYSSARNWVFHKMNGKGQDVTLAENSANYCVVLFNGAKLTNYLALKVMFPRSGIYTVDVFGLVRDRAPQLEMFLIPATSENEANLDKLLVSNNEYHFGTGDFTNATEEIGKWRSFGTNEVSEPGEYFVVFRTLTRSGWGGDCWYPLYMNFTDATAVNSAKLVEAEGRNEMEVNETITFAPEFYSGAGDKAEFDENLLGKLIYKSSNESVATVDENGVVTGINEGKVKITADILYDGTAMKAEAEIFVKDTSGIDFNLGIETMAGGPIYAYATTNIILKVAMNSGRWVEIPTDYITYEVVSGAECADVAEDGMVTGREVGTIVVQPSVNPTYKEGIGDIEIAPAEIVVQWDATVNPAIHTLRDRENVKRNAARYTWAKDEVKSAIATADKYIDKYETIYNLAVPEGLPRWYHVGHTYDPKKFYCRYCNCNIGLEYGSYGWAMNALTNPWKILCPDCGRKFPSNDFEGFYKLGLSDSGTWSYERALRKHHELFVCENGAECACENAPHPKNDRMSAAWKEYYGFGKGYLVNKLYPEMDEKLGVVGWGVDDSLGYMQPYISAEKAAEIAGPDGDINSVQGYDTRYYDKGDGYAWYRDGATTGPVQHTYVAYYVHEAVWYGAGGGSTSAVLTKAINAFRQAFLYTGEAKYGRAGAILLDKVADLYPDFDWYQWGSWRGDSYRGNIVDAVWSCGLATNYATAYDAFLPIYNDPYVAKFLSEHGARYETDENGDWKRDENGELIPVNLKNSPGALRKNVEDNILLRIYEDTLYGKIWGNFGMHQNAVTAAAVALNRLPETGEMLDWIMRDGSGYNSGPPRAEPIKGGYVMTQLINQVDRDGHGTENAPGYNNGWINNLSSVADLLAGYELYPSADLYKNPKFLKMFLAQAKLTLGGYYATQTGDSGAVGSTGIAFGFQPSIALYQITKDRELARAIYMTKDAKGNLGLRGTIYDDEPEIEEEIKKIVEEDGRYSLGSDMMAGYGFAALRAGAYYESASAITRDDTNRDFAVYFGANNGHGHADTLNLFMSAFGLNVAPELGYPEQTGAQPNRYEWVRTTISHNTVVVDEAEQKGSATTGTPYHFDDSGRVKLLDVGSSYVYPQTDEYRRTVMMIEASDDISYGIDFFHVKGGNDHLYSFHSQSDDLSAVSGLSDVKVTPMYTDEAGNLYGTYAGPDVKYGADPGGVNSGIYPRGYTWLKNIRTYKSIDKDFSVEFNVKDWRNVMDKKRDVRLRLTMLNDEPLSEVTFATAVPPQTVSNKGIGDLEYLLVRNKGQNIDTVFTTVFEPYEAGNKYIEKIEKLSMERVPGTKPGLNDAFGAVRVTLANGRTDIVIYATNNEINYIVDEKINFRGFAGVMSFENIDGEEKVVYTYLNDGEVLKLIEDESEEESLAAYTGKVKSFTREFASQNSITYTPSAGEEVDVENLAGKFIYVTNDKVENATYGIVKAEKSGNDIVLDIGDVTLIRSFIDAGDMDRGYIYNIAEGQEIRIPLPATADSSPIFDEIGDYTASVGGTIRIPINVESPIGKDVTLIGTSMPRGMTISEDGKSLVWKPDSSQVGKNHIAITANDGTLETTVHFTVEVYGSTGGGAGSGSSGTTGSMGNTGTITPTIPATPGADKKDETTTPSTPSTPTTPDVESDSNVRFVDLGNHAWAADAINALADEGIIKGTSENTFSPAANITRADFAILLVRAFKMTSESEENFADVSSSDYFAKELAVARNTGLVNGIGDNKFAPRNNITRQDMMVIVYRALVAMEKIATAENTPSASDFDTVADYAKEAVSALIDAKLVNGKNGLIDPTAPTTRAEVAVLIARILDYIA